MSLVAIVEQMADQVRAALVDADAGWDFQVEPGAITNPTPPAIDFYEGDPATDQESASFGATAAEMTEGIIITARARVSTNDNEGNQEILLALSDPDDEVCLVQSIYDDATLSGYAQDTHLLSKSGLSLIPTIDGSNIHYGVVWRFLVIPANS